MTLQGIFRNLAESVRIKTLCLSLPLSSSTQFNRHVFVSGMSFLKGLIDSFGSVFSSDESHPNPSPPPDSSTMDGVAGPSSVSNERVAYKLKGYFELAKDEIAKAVRAEEWGLVDDAIAHYSNAQRILVEATSTPVPSYVTLRFSTF